MNNKKFAIVVEDESMLPDFKPGDVAIVDPTIQPEPGDFVVARFENENISTLRQYKPAGVNENGFDNIELAPTNEVWSSIYINSDSPGEVIGKVVSFQRDLK